MNFYQEIETTTTDVARFCTKLENKLNKSIKAVEFLVAYCRTKGKTSQDSLRSTPQDLRLIQNGSRLGLIYGANTFLRRMVSTRL